MDRELVAAQDVSIRHCVYLFVLEVVGSNSAPATKIFVARKSYGFRAFPFLVYLAGESLADPDSINYSKQINH